MRILILFVSLCFSITSIRSQSWQDTVLKIDGIINKHYAPLAPGGQLSISRNGKLLYQRAWGLADLERQVPMTVRSKIEAGSVSKQFTAAAVLLLEQQGKLSLNDDIRKYFPELRFYGDTIRIDHLMRHSSGLRDWGAVAAITGWPRSSKFYRNEDALEIISWQKRLNNRPGDEFIYSNSGYNLMAMLVQRVSGQTLASFCRKYIFEPAQMSATEWRDDPERIVSDRALAYSPSGSGFRIEMPNEFVYGNGGLITTTEDLLKWNAYYSSGRLGTSSLYAKQTSAAPFNNGAMNNYGAGLFLQPVMGWRTINHSGATAGYRAWLVYYPELDLTIAMLSNTPKNFGPASNEVFGIFAPEKKAVQQDSAVVQNLDLAQFAGVYRNDKDGAPTELSVNGKELQVDKRTVKAVSEREFRLGERRLLMGGKNGFISIGPNRDTVHYSRTEPALPASAFHTYIGKYYSEETHSTILVDTSAGKLTITLKPGETLSLLPAYKDGFNLPTFGGTVYFTRAKKNASVTTMWISISRARKVEFQKRE